MKRFEIFDFFAEGFAASWKYYLVQGLLLLGFGILILLFPALLIVMVASFFILLGVIFLSFAWRSRQFQKKYNHMRTDLFDVFES